MDEADIRLYLRAKRQRKQMKTASIVSLVVFAIAPFVYKLVFNDWGIFPVLSPVMMAHSAFVLFGHMGVTQPELLSVIERQINRDADAMRYLSEIDS